MSNSSKTGRRSNAERFAAKRVRANVEEERRRRVDRERAERAQQYAQYFSTTPPVVNAALRVDDEGQARGEA